MAYASYDYCYVGDLRMPSGTFARAQIISCGYVNFIWDNTTQNVLNDAGRKSLAVHESGHACGYNGHDTTSSSARKSLMNPYFDNSYLAWGLTAPTTSDITQMHNFTY